MFAFLARQRLVRKGLASAKWRRRLTQREWLDSLKSGAWARWGILLGVALALASVLSLETGGEVGTERLILGVLMYVLAVSLLWLNHRGIWRDNARLLLILGTLVVHSWLVRCVLGESADAAAPAPVSAPGQWSDLERRHFWELLVPHAFGPMLISVLLGQRLGIVLSIFGSLFGAMFQGGIDAQFLVTSLLIGFVAALMTRDVRRRSDLLKAGVLTGGTALLLSVLIGPVGAFFWNGTFIARWDKLLWQCAAAVVSGVGTALLISGILPVLEASFRITTSITWLELADLNHPLLRRMTLEAPGSYHHSLMVAQLAEAAAEAIGANATMARVCSYFHDVGKLIKPEYFVENARHGLNPHADLAPTMSALIIIAHVKEGVDLAIKHRLNREIIDVIQQHHGTSTVYFFYRKALSLQESHRSALRDAPGDPSEEPPEVSEDSFRYHGPKPQTRECAIISLADCVESASRSLDKVTPHKVDQLVEEIIQKRLMDGELRECPLRMTELCAIAESFKRTLRSMLHSRIAYPKPVSQESRPRAERAHLVS